MVKVAILASGNGGNFENIVLFTKDKELKKEELKFQVKVLITDKETSYVRKRAENLKIDNYYISPKEYASKRDYEDRIIEILKENKIELIVLAGYMRIIGKDFIREYKDRILNIHPAYLPEFPGRYGIRDAFNSGTNRTGVTVHWVDEGVDTGVVVYQERIEIKKEWNMEKLEEIIHEVEHRIYPKVIQGISEQIMEGK